MVIQLSAVIVLPLFFVFVSGQKLRSAQKLRLDWVKIVPAPKENVVLACLGFVNCQDTCAYVCL